MMQMRMRHKSPHFWFAAGSRSNLAKTKLKNGLSLVAKAIYLVNVSVVCGTLYSQQSTRFIIQDAVSEGGAVDLRKERATSL